jgi:hypothetical protein
MGAAAKTRGVATCRQDPSTVPDFLPEARYLEARLHHSAAASMTTPPSFVHLVLETDRTARLNLELVYRKYFGGADSAGFIFTWPRAERFR